MVLCACLKFIHRSSVGSPRRDAATSTLIAPGEDLNAPGVTEWCFDVIYVTWICQVGTSLFGEFVWWLYLSVSIPLPCYATLSSVYTACLIFCPVQIPLYAGWKLYTFVIAPMFGLRSTGPSLAPPVAANGNGTAQTTSNGDAAESLSRKQQKAQKKAEKKGSGGIPRR